MDEQFIIELRTKVEQNWAMANMQNGKIYEAHWLSGWVEDDIYQTGKNCQSCKAVGNEVTLCALRITELKTETKYYKPEFVCIECIKDIPTIKSYIEETLRKIQ